MPSLQEMGANLQQAQSQWLNELSAASSFGVVNPTVAAGIDRLVSDSSLRFNQFDGIIASVLAGQANYDAALDWALTDINALRDARGLKDRWSISAVTSRAVSDAAVAVKNVGQTLTDGPSSMKWLVVGLIAVAVIYTVSTIKSFA